MLFLERLSLADFTIRDDNTKIRITCLKRDGGFFNLTGHKVYIKFRIRDVDHPRKEMTIIDAVNGVAEYRFTLGSGIEITITVNDMLDIHELGGGAGLLNLLIPPGLYPKVSNLCETIQDLMDTAGMGGYAECSFDALTGLVTLGSNGFPTKLLFGSGVGAARSVGPTLGFDPVDYDNGYGKYTGIYPVVPITVDDLAEEGIMYAEFEIVEDATQFIVSSSEVTVLTVRGKVTDD